jgi:hypothetical protein
MPLLPELEAAPRGRGGEKTGAAYNVQPLNAANAAGALTCGTQSGV